MGRVDVGAGVDTGGFLSRREVLEAVAAGRLDPGDAVPLLQAQQTEAGADPLPLRRVSVRSAYRLVRVVADPAEPHVSVLAGRHALLRDGDVLRVTDGTEPAPYAVAAALPAGELVVRLNPSLDVELDVTGGRLHLQGPQGRAQVTVKSGSALLEDVRGPLHLELVGGSASLLGTPTADWQVRVESASLVVRLAAGSDVVVVPVSTHSNVDVLGTSGPGSLGAGTHTLAVDAAFADVHVLASDTGGEPAWPST